MAAFSIDNELLIPLVEQNPVLWDKTMTTYKNRIDTAAAWKKIMLTLNPDFKTRDERTIQAYAKLVVQRWTHIRDNYNRSCKKRLEQKMSGYGVIKLKPYVYSKWLTFLKPVIQTKDPVCNENEETGSEDHDNNSEAHESSDKDSLQTNEMVKLNAIPIRMLKRPSNDYSEEEDALDVKMMRYMNSTNNEIMDDRHLSFFKGILPSLRMLDEDEVLSFQMGVIQLLRGIKRIRHNSV